tara:strand:- start:59 stop:373 length:315 start_codon:yes stop_codon:yes gene_type:complete
MSENLHKRGSSMRMHGFGISPAYKLLNHLDALGKGKRMMETIPNPNSTQTNKPLIRIQKERKYSSTVTSQISPKRKTNYTARVISYVILKTGVREICRKEIPIV